MLEKCKMMFDNCFEGDVTLAKLTLWLIAALCFTVGIVYGLMLAPWTKGVSIGSNNVIRDDCRHGRCCMGEDEED